MSQEGDRTFDRTHDLKEKDSPIECMLRVKDMKESSQDVSKEINVIKDQDLNIGTVNSHEETTEIQDTSRPIPDSSTTQTQTVSLTLYLIP